ncbi:MAG: DUF5606 domain-containing protein [Bacteroidales bacterium]|nr:DUF5606 domain-containing protein [Candidatus Cacconaster merdequi]
MEKTDLKKILSISGEHGLFAYVAQARNGLIAESLETKVRKAFGPSAKVSSLADISIYTTTEEKSLQDVLTAMAAKLDGKAAISSKADQKAIKAFFDEVIPDYDADRFYFSHMKKVLDWYNCLQQFATLDFVVEEEENKETEE